jgi:hypothetical protein
MQNLIAGAVLLALSMYRGGGRSSLSGSGGGSIVVDDFYTFGESDFPGSFFEISGLNSYDAQVLTRCIQGALSPGYFARWTPSTSVSRAKLFEIGLIGDDFEYKDFKSFGRAEHARLRRIVQTCLFTSFGP